MLNYDQNSNEFNPGYAIELEDRDALRATATRAEMLMMGDLPARVDPRQHKLYLENWLQVEDQGQIGSCQGQALTECGEYCYTILTGKVIQLSRMYAYIASQMESNIRSDSGSTLSGGTAAFLKGICLESIAPYPSRYPGWSWVTEAMKADAKKYLLKSHTEMKSAEDVKRFIGSGIGIVQIGITWGGDMSPDSNGCIKRFSGMGGGGHSVVFAGYVTDEDVGVKSTTGWWGLLKNSWSKRWGKAGFAYVDPSAIDSMLRGRFTVMYGRSDMTVPEPRVIDIKFTDKGNSLNG